MYSFTSKVFNTTDPETLTIMLKDCIYQHYDLSCSSTWCREHPDWKTSDSSLSHHKHSNFKRVLILLVSRMAQLGYLDELRVLWEQTSDRFKVKELYPIVYLHIHSQSKIDYIFTLNIYHIKKFITHLSPDVYIEPYIPQIVKLTTSNHHKILVRVLQLYPNTSEVNVDLIMQKLTSFKLSYKLNLSIFNSYLLAKYLYWYNSHSSVSTHPDTDVIKLLYSYYEQCFDTNQGDYIRRLLHKYGETRIIDGMFLELENSNPIHKLAHYYDKQEKSTPQTEMLRMIGMVLKNTQVRYPRISKINMTEQERSKLFTNCVTSSNNNLIKQNLWSKLTLEEEYHLILDLIMFRFNSLPNTITEKDKLMNRARYYSTKTKVKIMLFNS